LARRRTPPPSPSLRLQARRPQLRHTHAQGTRRRKKSPSLGSLKALAEAWTEAQPINSHGKSAVRELAQAVGSIRPHELNSIIPNALIESWRKKYSYSTAHARRYGLSRFLRWLSYSGGPREPYENLTRMRQPGPRTLIAQDDELQRLLQNAEPWLRCWLLLTGGLALRFSEALHLPYAAWNQGANTLTLTTKGHQTLTLPVTPELTDLLTLCPQPDPMTPILQLLRGEKVSREIVRRAWNRLKEKAHVNKHLRPHDLRRTVAVRLYNQTHDIIAVQQLLGHTNLRSTAWYLAHYDPARLKPLLVNLQFPTQKMPTELKQ